MLANKKDETCQFVKSEGSMVTKHQMQWTLVYLRFKVLTLGVHPESDALSNTAKHGTYTHRNNQASVEFSPRIDCPGTTRYDAASKVKFQREHQASRLDARQCWANFRRASASRLAGCHLPWRQIKRLQIDFKLPARQKLVAFSLNIAFLNDILWKFVLFCQFFFFF